MGSTQMSNEHATQAPSAGAVDMIREVVVIPVSDVDRANVSTESWGGGWTPISLSTILVHAIEQPGNFSASDRTSKGGSTWNGKTSWLDISPATDRGPLDD